MMIEKVANRLLILVLAIALGSGMGGCKSQKKLAKEQAAAEYAAKVDKAKKDLTNILNDNTDMTLDQKEALVKSIRDMDLDDDEVRDLLAQAEEKLAGERSEWNRQAMEAKMKEDEARKRMETASVSLQDYFSNVAKAASVSEANMFINEALGLFSSPDSPVLIIISREGDIVDYDRPTTILNYLNYLKDTGNDINKVEKVSYDDYGKIKELELIKTY